MKEGDETKEKLSIRQWWPAAMERQVWWSPEVTGRQGCACLNKPDARVWQV